MPTILDWFSRTPADIEGKSLMPIIAGRDTRPRPAYMEYNLYWGQKCAFFDGRYKLIAEVTSERELKQSKSFMYDLETDPSEKKKIKGDHPRFSKLRKHLTELRESLKRRAEDCEGPNEAARLDEETVKALEAMGYVSEGGP